MRWLLRGMAFIAVLAAVAAFWLWRDYQNFLDTPLHSIEGLEVSFILEPGTSYPAMVEQMHSAGYTNVTWHWRVLGRMQQPVIKAGEYRIAAHTTPLQWLDQLERGEVIQHQFTIVEGWTTRELLQRLQDQPLLSHNSEDLSTRELLTAISAPQTTDWLLSGVTLRDEIHEYAILEGLFLPETYSYHRGESDLALLQRAHQSLLGELENAWQRVDAARLPLEHPYQLLTLASIIEKETGVASEREQIAGVFARRLQRGMLLQTDPTVIYGIGESYDGNIRRRDLETDTVYNTYTRAGLPPTPIALAGAAAIQAAADPADGDALYFVASGNGGHVFSATLAEHNRAVQQYLQQLRNKRSE